MSSGSSDADLAVAAVRKWLAAQELAIRTAKRYESRDHPKRVATRHQSIVLEQLAARTMRELSVGTVVVDGVRYRAAPGAWGTLEMHVSPAEEPAK
jgi:hypothetical protein